MSDLQHARETALAIIEEMEQDKDLLFSRRVALPQAVRAILDENDRLRLANERMEQHWLRAQQTIEAYQKMMQRR